MTFKQLFSLAITVTLFVGQAQCMFFSRKECEAGLQEWGHQLQKRKEMNKKTMGYWKFLLQKNQLIPFFERLQKIRGYNPNKFRKVNGGTALMFASKHEPTGSITAHLLRCGEADVNVTNAKGQTALSIALDKEHPECIRQLVQHPDLKVSAEELARIKDLF